jgi:hypothetical protein
LMIIDDAQIDGVAHHCLEVPHYTSPLCLTLRLNLWLLLLMEIT